jgi:hypothetical protein
MRPEPGTAGEQTGSQQVAIDIADAETVKPAGVDEVKNLLMRSHRCLWELSEVCQNRFSVLEISAGKFPPNEGVDEHGLILEKGDKVLVTRTQVVYPDRGIHEDHADSVLRL